MNRIVRKTARFSTFAYPLLVLAVLALPTLALADEQAQAAEHRLAETVQYLASDELQGRGLGSEGLEKAAKFIADHFQQAGLELAADGGFQPFRVTTSAKPSGKSRLALVGPPAKEGEKPRRLELRQGKQFMPLAMSGSGEIDLPLVFVGYGITAKEEEYDDYDGVDVSGKAVILLRHEPQQENPDSGFAGTKDSQHAFLRRKVSNAFEHGAAAVVFCTDHLEIQRNVLKSWKKWNEALDRLAQGREESKLSETPAVEEVEAEGKRIGELVRQIDLWAERLEAAYDPVLPFSAGGPGSDGRDFPVIHCRRAELDQAVKAALGTDLATLETRIDDGPTPHSQELAGWRLAGRVEVERTQAEVKNVVAVLPGSDPKCDEAVVLGAHYDHLGMGGAGSLEPGKKAIHNGADDNASGVAVLLEVARSLAQRDTRPRRAVVFAAFTGEESGLLGSSRYVRDPVVPVEKTAAMVNLDMVGRLRDDKLIVIGAGTSSGFGELLKRINQEHGFELTTKPGGFGPSDQAAFYAKKVPVLHFFTGTHANYHRPSDDFETLNVAGMRRVAAMVTDVVAELADAGERPDYVSVAPVMVRAAGDRPYFGSIPDFSGQGPGYSISGVAEGGPAQRAGLEGGDSIVQFGESKIGSLADFDSALRKYEGGDRVRTVVLRDGKELTFEVTLDPPR